MDTDRSPSSTTLHLFTVRVWREELGSGHSEWRGKVQHPLSGETWYFQQWTELIAFVREQLSDIDPAAETVPTPSGTPRT